MKRSRNHLTPPRLFLALLLMLAGHSTIAATLQELLTELDEYPHAQLVESSDKPVLDHELGLGSMKKVRGVWGFKDSERKSGQLQSYTWQILDGFSSEEVMQGLQASLGQQENATVLFSCDGRSCGHGAQWANRVFRQRVLYGREELQRYRIYAVQDAKGTEYRLVIYSAARTADRQYLHVELLQITQ